MAGKYGETHFSKRGNGHVSGDNVCCGGGQAHAKDQAGHRNQNQRKERHATGDFDYQVDELVAKAGECYHAGDDTGASKAGSNAGEVERAVNQRLGKAFNEFGRGFNVVDKH